MHTFSVFRRVLPLLIIALLLSTVAVTLAQGGVTVTTRDNATLRSGPGRENASLAVVPFNTTMPATGRNEDNSWLQVDYNGQSGWIATFLLNWVGDLNSLPVGGVQPAAPAGGAAAPAAPAGGVTATNASVMNVRSGPSTSSSQLGRLPAGSTVALNGRWGSGSSAWVRFDFNGQVGWLASWLLTISGDLNSLTDVQAEQAAQSAAIAAAQNALPTVCQGATVPLAAPYVPGAGVHPVALFYEDGTAHPWSGQLGAWAPATPLAAQLVACASRQMDNVIQECLYNGPSIFRHLYAINVRVVVAQTGQVLGTTTITGTPPRECRHTEPWSLVRLDGGSVTFAQLQQWLAPFVTQ